MLTNRPAASQTQIRHTLAPLIERAAQTPDADRYRKHFPARAHLWILVLHALLPTPSLRQTHVLLSALAGCWRQWGMAAPISFSQLARSSTSRPAACFEAVVADLSALVARRTLASPKGRLLQRVRALDSTFLRLSAKLAPWSKPTRFAPGSRLQLTLLLESRAVGMSRLTSTQINDHTALATTDLEPYAGSTLIFDLGYYGHQHLARLRTAEVSFITRLHPQAAYQVTARQLHPATAAPLTDDQILADQTIRLGSPNNRRGAVLEDVRLVCGQTPAGKALLLLTDRFDLTAAEVIWLYRQRWQIELFFRWLKHDLGLRQPLGYSPAALYLTVLVSLIAALVLQLGMPATARTQPTRTQRTQLQLALLVNLFDSS